MRPGKSRYLLVAFAALAVAAGLKVHYHSATSADLAWILAPTAALVNGLTGAGFAFGEERGYCNVDESFVIAPACAGVNFLIISFCMLVFVLLRRDTGMRAGLATLMLCGAAAYGATLLVNAARIALSIRAARPASSHAWLGYDAVHRMEGIALYFLALSLLYLAAQRFSSRFQGSNDRGPARIPLAIPLAWYLLVTLGIPILRMSFRGDPWSFIEHSLYVLLIPAGLILTFAGVLRLHAWFATLRWPRKLAMAAVLVLLPALAFSAWDVRPSDAPRFDRGRNGLWLGQQWYTGFNVTSGEAVSEEEVNELLTVLEEHGVRYAYPFAGPITPAGTLLGEPTAFFAQLRRRAPEVQFLPWVSGKAELLPMADPSWRERVIETMGQLYASGIRGIHLDIEPIQDEHPGYIELLQEIREQFDGQFFVSQATRRVAPFGVAAGPLANHFWSGSFYAASMKASDQTVLMGYNTLLESPKLYRAYMAHQTRLLLDWAVEVPEHQVLIGIPSYDDVPDYSNPEVENIQNALWGVLAALEKEPVICEPFEGIAVFAEWTTSPEEWRSFRQNWHTPTQSPALTSACVNDIIHGFTRTQSPAPASPG